MRTLHHPLASAALLLAFVGLVPACSCSGTTAPTRPCTTLGDCPAGQICVDSVCELRAGTDAGPDATTLPDGSRPDSGDAGPACTTDTDCPAGACVGGGCCAEANVCGSSCCGGGEVCFANACVTPGDTCLSTADCATGEYCETGLGSGGADGGVPDGGVGDAGTRVCLGGRVGAGRCLALPPRCAAGEDGSDGHCIPVCEYHPTVGPLDAVEQWHWGPDNVVDRTGATDVWSSPAVGRVYDTNCDGHVDINDPPNVVFVSGNSQGTYCMDPLVFGTATACKAGSLRILDGLTGAELVSVRRAEAGSTGFAGVSVALADVNADGVMEVIAATGEGKLAVLAGDGTVLMLSSQVIPDHTVSGFGWGGDLSVADMDGDGAPEIAYGHTLFTTMGGTLTRLFNGAGERGGAPSWALSTFVDLDGDGQLELLGGQTAYRMDGTMLWNRTDLTQYALPGVADLDGDGLPEVVLVRNGQLLVLEGLTGATELGPMTIPGTGRGGPPTIADMDGDGAPEIGLAMATFYSVLKPNYAGSSLDVLWSTANHDLSSSVTGSTVFDFEGDGIAEVIYNDECYLWVYDGPTGSVRFATPTLSFTATESSLVADIDGDGHAEMLMISNGADPSASGWKCNIAPWNTADPATGRPAWAPPPGASVYRGITVFRDSANSWVGTRALWNEHTYHVTNVCDDRDTACMPAASYGAIPAHERTNWTVPWLNNFRQNVQDGRLFDAPDAVVSLSVDCTHPPVMHAALRNAGAAILPAGVVVGFYAREAGGDVRLGSVTSTAALFPGQATVLTLSADGRDPTVDTFVAKIEVDAAAPLFRECHDDNNESAPVMARCLD